MSKKVVVMLEVHGDKDKQKAMKAVSSLPGIESLSMNMKDKKLTVIGDVDPVQVVARLRKCWHTEILTVGPSKEPEKPQNSKDSGNKPDPNKMVDLSDQYKNWNTHPWYNTYYSVQENPNSCVIC